MIDFTTPQLSWIVIGAISIGGTGYVTLNNKVDDMATKVAVVSTQMDDLKIQLTRIENKLDKKSDK
jgi:hypothetical protein